MEFKNFVAEHETRMVRAHAVSKVVANKSEKKRRKIIAEIGETVTEHFKFRLSVTNRDIYFLMTVIIIRVV